MAKAKAGRKMKNTPSGTHIPVGGTINIYMYIRMINHNTAQNKSRWKQVINFLKVRRDNVNSN